VFLGVLLFCIACLVYVSLVLPFILQSGDTGMRVGGVAPREILAPYSLTYESLILTERQRQQAVQRVALVYTPADPAVGRQQLERLQAALAFINSVRSDAYAAQEQKLSDLSFLEHIYLQQPSANAILTLSDARWQTVKQEAIVVLEQMMRNSIRTEQLGDARRNLPAAVNYSLDEEQATLGAELAAAFLSPNSAFDQEATEMAYQKAREQVEPVTRSFLSGEILVQRGQVITDVDLEALYAYGLMEAQGRMPDSLGAAAMTILTALFFVMFFYRNPGLLQDVRALTLGSILFTLILLGGRVMIPGHTVLPYLYPLAAYSLTIAMIFGPDLALMSTLPLAFLISYGLANPLELTLFYALGGIFGVLALRRSQRLTSFFWAAAMISISGAFVVIAYRVPQPSTDLLGLLTLTLASALNGVISAGVGILLQFLLAQSLGRVTALQLIELSRPDHPLIQFLLQNAPGTYQHSLQVATLAEQAAERIGADTLLTRVGGMYHDAGKAANPGFFIENQLAGQLNPHHNIEPVISATTIIRHVADGLELARKYRLPQQIQAFIAEHHGTLITRYQYVRAVETAGGDESRVDIHQFRYPGPRPQSRETALLMLADGCEASVRAERPKDENELRMLIRKVIDERVKHGQLDDTTLTLRDLDTVVEAFTASLRGIYHPRIQYPTLEKPAEVPQPQPPSEPVETQPFLGIDAPTDVLSFSDGDLDPETGAPYLGDILISVERAQAQARSAGHTLQEELTLLVVHGVLHLLGHDHAEPEQKARMWSLQAEILTDLGSGRAAPDL